MQEGLKVDKNVEFNLFFSQDDIKHQYEQYEKAAKPHGSSVWNQNKKEVSTKVKVISLIIVIVFFLLKINME